MKVINSSHITSFGGLNFVLAELESQGIGQLLNSHLPRLCKQSQYSWKDIFYSYWSVLFCGGDCAEDLDIHFKDAFKRSPFIKVPSPDRLLDRMKQLSEPSKLFKTDRGNNTQEFSLNNPLNIINIKMLKKLHLLELNKNLTLDYDNTMLPAEKADATMTYLNQRGYMPGVAFIGSQVVYVENRNGKSNPQTLQQDTLTRMFEMLTGQGIKIDRFRADSASYQLSTLSVISKNVNTFFIRTRMSESLSDAIRKIENWARVSECKEEQEIYRGSTPFVPFHKIAERQHQQHLLTSCRLIITKEKRKDGQIDLFTGEAFNYYGIITNDDQMSDDHVVEFYNQRGASEREFDVLKNDFLWNHMPFSKLEQNTVFLLMTAMCKNLYNFIIKAFSHKYAHLSPKFRIKKFRYRFICIPARWIKSGRTPKLRIYGILPLKT
jgi:hypothetical protein